MMDDYTLGLGGVDLLAVLEDSIVEEHNLGHLLLQNHQDVFKLIL
jgi:hypothetical protein